jgi:hypothetical protein
MEQTLGARLRSQRERQRVALVTIAEETKINATLLEGLERDDISRWPGGLFRRAYVRTYAQKIGLDPEQVLRDFLAVYPDPVEATSPVEAIAQNTDAKRPRTRIGLMFASLAQRRPQRRPEWLGVQHRTADMFATEDHAPAALNEMPVAQELAPAVEPQPLVEPREVATAAPKLVMIAPTEAGLEPRRDLRAFERSVAAVARLCTRVGCVRDEEDLGTVLEDAVSVLDARGVILWIWDPDRDVLFPGLAHGYSAELLGRLPEVDRRADNAIAATFCCGQEQVVRGSSDATGAFVAPLLTPDGCVGALALEFANGGEQHELVQTLATILTAQLSTLFSSPPVVTIDEEDWTQQDRSLVAS